MSPHSRSDHDAVTMGSLIIILIAVTVYCSETQCGTSPNLKIAITKSEDAGHVEKNNVRAIEKGILWKNLDLSSRKSMYTEEPKSLRNQTNRKSRLLNTLAFLTGLGFGSLATAASSTSKTIAKLPQTSFSVNLDSSNGSPYLAAYYNPHSLLSYPFFFPFGFAPINPARSQTTLHNDLTPQVISVLDRQPANLAEDNEDYLDEEKKSINNKKMNNGENDRTESRVKVDRNAEEKMYGYKESQRKYGNSLKESTREREDLQVNADDSQATLNFRAVNMIADGNQTATENATMTTSPPRFIFGKPSENKTHPCNHSDHQTEHPPFLGYYGGYPQNINHVDLTGLHNTHYDHNRINYNLPHEQPANFYQNDDKYNVYSNSYFNPPFRGPFPPDQVNEYVATDVNQLYHSPEYQTPYNNGFRPLT